MKKAIKITLIILLVLVSLALMAYPAFYAWYSDQHQAEVLTQYQEEVEKTATEELEAILAAAQAYNQELFAGNVDVATSEGLAEAGYYDLLDPTGSGIMGYIRIPSLGINLPIYHGVGDSVLSLGVGHMPQSSLPVGGTSTHTVLSAHSGSSSPMFSDLELLEIGDVFYLDVLGETLAYQVIEIDTVLPEDITSIKIRSGEDLCTLVTCTPFGVNTHRLLVTGTRIELEEEPEETNATEDTGSTDSGSTESVWKSQYLHYIRVGLVSGTAAALLLWPLVLLWRKKRRNKRKEKQNAESDNDSGSPDP